MILTLGGVRPHLSVFYQTVKKRPSFVKVTDWKNHLRKGILMLFAGQIYYFLLAVRRDVSLVTRTGV